MPRAPPGHSSFSSRARRATRSRSGRWTKEIGLQAQRHSAYDDGSRPRRARPVSSSAVPTTAGYRRLNPAAKPHTEVPIGAAEPPPVSRTSSCGNDAAVASGRVRRVCSYHRRSRLASEGPASRADPPHAAFSSCRPRVGSLVVGGAEHAAVAVPAVRVVSGFDSLGSVAPLADKGRLPSASIWRRVMRSGRHPHCGCGAITEVVCAGHAICRRGLARTRRGVPNGPGC
jgi:hypothetical protein